MIDEAVIAEKSQGADPPVAGETVITCTANNLEEGFQLKEVMANIEMLEDNTEKREETKSARIIRVGADGKIERKEVK